MRDLHTATQINSRLNYEACLQRFDAALRSFFERFSANDVQQAAEQLVSWLNAEATSFRGLNKSVAAIFDGVMTAIHDKASTWHYQADLERFHVQGRELARRFFIDSPWPEAQERLSRECHLTVEYGAPADDDWIAKAERFHYHAAPVAYYPSNNAVLARFTLGHSFDLYLAYPFLFLHEYSAHVYATDYGNELFNDGWMIHAVDAFLVQERNNAPDQVGLSLEQVNIFRDSLYHNLQNNPRRGCRIARDVDSLLPDTLRHRFTEFTYELAVFQPSTKHKDSWPNRFINALDNEIRTDPKRLLRKIQASTSAQELMTTLSPD